MENKFDENLKDQTTTNIISIDQIIALKEALINLINQLAMIIVIDHKYTILESMDYRSDRFVTS